MTFHAECVACGTNVTDLPYEEMGLALDEGETVLFTVVDGDTYCQSCAPKDGAS